MGAVLLPHRGARGTSLGMRQLTCTGPGTVEWRDVPEPRLQSDVEALVRPLAVARCDIDLFLTSGAIPAREPFALGHECVGEVVALGDAVATLAIGQRVVVAFQVSCGTCRSCTAGHTANCDRFPVLSDYGMQQGRLRPGEVTTRVVGWEDAPRAYLEPAIKLIVRRA